MGIQHFGCNTHTAFYVQIHPSIILNSWSGSLNIFYLCFVDQERDILGCIVVKKYINIPFFKILTADPVA